MATIERRHAKLILVALAAAGLLWLYLRKSSATQGHATPAEAMSYGWAVYPRGVTGWQEHGPNGEIVDHDTGGEGVVGIGEAS
jgi:hypothetical protein